MHQQLIACLPVIGATPRIARDGLMRYFFNLSNGRKLFSDPTGREFAAFKDARVYALEDARWLLESWMIRSRACWTIEIADESGAIVGTITLSDAAVSEARPLFHALDDLAA